MIQQVGRRRDIAFDSVHSRSYQVYMLSLTQHVNICEDRREFSSYYSVALASLPVSALSAAA